MPLACQPRTSHPPEAGEGEGEVKNAKTNLSPRNHVTRLPPTLSLYERAACAPNLPRVPRRPGSS